MKEGHHERISIPIHANRAKDWYVKTVDENCRYKGTGVIAVNFSQAFRINNPISIKAND